MVLAPGIAVEPSQAEATRRRLRDAGHLRDDLGVVRLEGRVVFPVRDATPTGDYEFPARTPRPRAYTDLLDWPDDLVALAPRAFEAMGDIVVVKVPKDLWDRRAELGAALLDFHAGARAVFHDRGVKGEFRVRDLVLIAGTGDARTHISENGVRLAVDVSRAYFSPRLADERSRLVDLVRPGESCVDLFGGVAPFAVQAARKGAHAVCIDLNPDACDLARSNAEANGVEVDVRCGDARALAAELAAQGAAPVDRIVMNLPHGAHAFLDAAARLAGPGTVIHLHAITPDVDIEATGQAAVTALAQAGVTAHVGHTRHVRDYSTSESHMAYDLLVDEAEAKA